MTTTTYPRAEQFARTMSLPLTFCKVTKELYDHVKPILDVEVAKYVLYREGILSNKAVEIALEILEERVNRL